MVLGVNNTPANRDCAYANDGPRARRMLIASQGQDCTQTNVPNG
jgi:hypothetical protein